MEKGEGLFEQIFDADRIKQFTREFGQVAGSIVEVVSSGQQIDIFNPSEPIQPETRVVIRLGNGYVLLQVHRDEFEKWKRWIYQGFIVDRTQQGVVKVGSKDYPVVELDTVENGTKIQIFNTEVSYHQFGRSDYYSGMITGKVIINSKEVLEKLLGKEIPGMPLTRLSTTPQIRNLNKIRENNIISIHILSPSNLLPIPAPSLPQGTIQ